MTLRVRNWNGTVHYAQAEYVAGTGRPPVVAPACGPVATHKGWLTPSVATVTCKRCIAMFGADEPGHTDAAAPVDENVARRAAERTARREARAVA